MTKHVTSNGKTLTVRDAGPVRYVMGGTIESPLPIIVHQFIDVVTSMCSRIFGNRSAKNRRDSIVNFIREQQDATRAQDRAAPEQGAD